MSEREEIRGCVILTNLHYAVQDHTWVDINEDGKVIIGMTDVAQNMAGPILHAKLKRVGTERRKGRPVATVESSKWVGPVKLPLSGTVVEINEQLADDPEMINRSPYKKGWLVKLDPSDLENELQELVTGDAAVQMYRDKIENDDLRACEHVEGFED